MKHLLFLAAFIGASIAAMATGTGNTINIATGTKVVASGNVFVSSTASFFINDGTYTDTSGTLNILAGLTFSGSGTTSLQNLVINNGGSTTLNSVVSVYNTATIAAGSVSVGAGNLFIRSDINSSANLVNNGILNGTVQGLITKATAITGGCPSYSSTLSLNISGSSMQYQWQSSTDSASWTDITGATSATYTATVATSTYYRCNLSTTNSSYSQATPALKLIFTGVIPTITLGSSPSVTSGTTSADLPYTATSGSPTIYSIVYGSTAIGAGFSNVTSASLPSTSPIILTVPAAAPVAVYTGTVTASNGCTSTGTEFTVTVGSSFDATITKTNVSCHDGSNGAATATVLGGTAPYTYSWSPSGGTGTTATGLIAGTYTLTITDATAAVISRTVTVTEPTAITISGTQNNVTCNGGNSGSATVSVSGGTGSYSYLWSPGGSTLSTATGLAAGTYTCTVTDANSCPGMQSFIITQPSAMTITGSKVNVTCNGGSDGSATVTVTGGTGSHYYFWSPSGSTSATATGLVAGTYTCAITDDNGCVALHYDTLTQPSAIVISGTQVNETCNGGNSGSATVTVTGGAGGYSYFWSPGGSTLASATGLSAGTFTCTVVDASGCTALHPFTITEPSAISIDGTETNVSCYGGHNGTASVTVSGGTGGYNYFWSPGSYTTATATGLSAGTYTCSVTDGSGCLGNTVFTITQPAPLSAISGSNTVCTGYSTTFTDTSAGGAWSSSNITVASVDAVSGVVSGITSGTATITYALTGECSALTTKVVTVTGLPDAGIITGLATVTVGSTITLSHSVTGGTWTADNSNASTSSTGVVTGVVAGTVTISYVVSNDCGSAAATKVITVNEAVSGISGTLSVCIGSTSLLSDPTSGGSWSSGSPAIATISTSGLVTAISAGTTTISYGSTTSGYASVIVTVYANPSPITGTMTMCGGAITTLHSSMGGGMWTSSDTTIASVGSFTGYASGLSSGTATITYTLGSGCMTTTVVTINANPSAITGAAGICTGATVTLSSSTTGGSWTSGDPTAATISSAGIATGVGGGISRITYTLPTGCKTTTSVTVYALPAAITGITLVCQGAITNLSNTTLGGTWSSSDMTVATIGTSGSVLGVAPGTTTITYVAATGCSRTTIVTVNEAPVISGALALCIGTTTTVTASLPGGTWSGGSVPIATIIPSGVISGVGVGTTNFTYTAAGTGCKSRITATVNATPAAISGTAKACPGTSTTLSNTTTGGTWISSDATIASVGATSGIVTGLTVGTTIVSYTTGIGCYKTTTITINASPAAIVGGTAPVCIGSSFTLTDATTGGTWTSSNTSIATVNTAGLVSGTGGGTATITYTAPSTNCIATTEVTINGSPAAITGPATACAGTTLTLSNSAPGGTWISSNTALATVGSTTGIVTAAASGVVTITYATGSGCNAIKQLTINSTPTVTGYPVVCIGLTTTLSGGTGTWISGNPSVATIATSGGYVLGVSAGTVAMTFTSPSSACPAIYVLTVTSTPAAITGATVSCQGNTVTLSNATPGGSWTSANTAVATVGSGTGIVTTVGSGGSTTITYSIGTSCRVTTTFTAKAVPAVIGGTAAICMPVVSTLTDVTAAGTWTSSNTSVATIGSALQAGNGVVTGVSAGTAMMTYTITSSGCYRTAVVTVTPGPDPGTLTSSTGAFTLRTVTAPTSLTLSSTGLPGGVWSSSNPAVATVSPSGVVSGLASGNTAITYTVTGACTNSAIRYIYVTAGKDAGANVDASDFLLYPNPTSGTFNLSTGESGTMAVYTIDGKLLYQFAVDNGTSVHSLKGDMAAGIYMCRFTGVNGSIATVRLIYEP